MIPPEPVVAPAGAPAAAASPAPRAARPLFACALATACGAGAAIALDLGPGTAPALGAIAAIGAIVVGAVAWVLGWSAAGGPAHLGAGERARASVSAAAWLALAAAGFGRAAAAGHGREPPEGEWRSSSTLHGREFGSVGALRGDALELGAGWAEEGERVRVLASAERTRPARGLEGGVGRVVRTPRADELVRLAPSRDHGRPLTRLRAELLRACDRAGGVEHGPWLRALVCGDTSRFDGETLDLFTRTGTRHLLAVSGQHVTWVAALALWPLSRLVGRLASRFLPGRPSRVAELVFLAGVAAYVPLAGGAPPARRAAVAFALAVAAGSFAGRERGGRRVDVLSLWSAALLAELVAAPRAIGEVSLLLSYAATLGLVVGSAPFARLFSPRRRFELGERWTRTLARRARGASALAFGASLAAVLATAPIAWSVFGELSIPGALITVVALPHFVLLLIGAWLWVLAPFLDLGALWIAVARALRAWFELADRLPGTPLVLPPRPWPLVALAAAASFAALASRAGPRPRACAAGVAALAWAALLLPWTAEPRGLEVVAFDVGHGTAVALRAPGAGAWLFDAGSRDRTRVAQAAVVPCLAAWDVGELGVIASHSDRDHVNALSWIAERFRPRVWAGALAGEARGRGHARSIALDLGAGTLRLSCAGGLELALVRGEERAGNQGSRSLRATFAGSSILLCGDAEGSALARQRDAEGFRGPVDVLLLPHHGSDPEGLGALLERTAPREAWISASAPAPVLAELERRGIPARETSEEGAIAFASAGAGP